MASQRRLDVVANQVVVASTVSASSDVGVDEVGDFSQRTKHFVMMPDDELTIVAPKAGLLSLENLPPETLVQVFERAAKNCAHNFAMAVERPLPPPEAPGVAPALPWEDWKKWTFADYHADVRRAAKGFIHLGLQQFGTVSVFGFNAPEWFLSAWGAIYCGAKYSGIYLTDTPDEVQYKVEHSGTSIIVVDGPAEFENVVSRINDMPSLKAIVAWGMTPPGDVERDDGSVCSAYTFEQLLQMGDGGAHDDELAARAAAMRPGQCLGIIYTSGTTGHPKAVMVHHDCLVAQGAWVLNETGGETLRDGRVLSYLPLSHIAGALVDMFGNVMYASHSLNTCVYFARPYDLKEMTMAARLGFVRPTVFFGVPRVYEKIMARMQAVGATVTGLKKRIATWAKAKGLEKAKNDEFGGSKGTPMLYGMADKVVLSKAREALGLDCCKKFWTGAAPITMETLEYFASLGMPILSLYGMSENSGLSTWCTTGANIFGTVGRPVQGAEFRVFRTGPSGELVEAKRCKPGALPSDEEQGELCYRGRHIMMGYMANPKFGLEHVAEVRSKNEASIDSAGWLHSGDKGCMDVNGFVRITGRYKELIIGSGGENIAPVPVEDSIKGLCPGISNIMMVGDFRPYNVALVTLLAEGATGELPGTDQLAGAALAVNPSVTTISGAIGDKKWRSYIQAGIDATNNNPKVCVSNAWKIQKFAILPRDFSIQTGELTSTLKLKRSVAADTWKETIDSLY